MIAVFAGSSCTATKIDVKTISPNSNKIIVHSVVTVGSCGLPSFSYPFTLVAVDKTNLSAEFTFESVKYSGVQNRDLFICDRKPTEQIVLLKQENRVVKDIREKSPTIVGFYTTRDNPHLKETYRDLEQAAQYGWGDFYDFIEGYVPPTPLYGLNQQFNDGDLIELELDVNKGYWTENGALRVVKAEKLPFPTRDELINEAELAYSANESDVFKCADAKRSDFESFKEGIKNSYIKWDREYNIALVSYYGQKEVRDSRGELQIVNIDIVLDREGEPTAIYVDSDFAVLSL